MKKSTHLPADRGAVKTLEDADKYLQDRLWLPVTESHMQDNERWSIFDAKQILTACRFLAKWEAYGNGKAPCKPGQVELIFH